MTDTFNISSDVNDTVNYRIEITDLRNLARSNDPERNFGWELYYQARNNKWVYYAAGCTETREEAAPAAEAEAMRHYRVYH